MSKHTKTIEIGELLKCQNPDCGQMFRWFSYNSTIKPKFCPRCKALKKFQQDRIRYNKKMLEQSNFYSSRNKNLQKKDLPPIRNKNDKIILSPHKRFYQSPAWKWFSKFILIINTFDEENTLVRCCTCGKIMKINSRKSHVGHYIKVFDGNSTNYAVAFVEANTGPQCLRCNKYMGGRQDEMAIWIMKKYGQDTLDKLNQLKKLPLRLTNAYLQEIADDYKMKFKNYLKEHNLRDPWKK